ncbi:MAG: Dabb family protein, partial [FCB group bacterium]|nr:Dabb family protein [FCB group bacterium]
MIKHIVFMKLKDGIDRESCLSEIKRRLEKLVDSIDEIRRFEVGINV